MKNRDELSCDLEMCGDLKICGDLLLEINCGDFDSVVGTTRIVGFMGDSGGSIPNADFDL